MFGITPMPIFDPTEEIKYLEDFMVFFKPGDIVKWKPINRAEYDRILIAVEDGTYIPRIAEVDFDLDDFNADMRGTNAKLLEALNDA